MTAKANTVPRSSKKKKKKEKNRPTKAVATSRPEERLNHLKNLVRCTKAPAVSRSEERPNHFQEFSKVVVVVV